MNRCRIHIFSKRADRFWFDTVGALHGAFPGDTASIFFDLGEFVLATHAVSGALVVILAPRDPVELEVLGRIRDSIWNRDVLIIAPEGGVPKEISAWFRPRVVLSEPVDAETVVETVRKMVSRETGRYRTCEQELQGMKKEE